MPRFEDIAQFERPAYQCDMPWWDLEGWIERHALIPGAHVDFDPPYQRAHVWTSEQQVAYVEFCLRGGESARNIYFNCSSWMGAFNTPIEIVDGKQRVMAVRLFMADELPAFGHTIDEYEDPPPMLSASLRIHVHKLQTRAEVIRWYLDLNYAGTPHTEEERERVRRMLEEEC